MPLTVRQDAWTHRGQLSVVKIKPATAHHKAGPHDCHSWPRAGVWLHQRAVQDGKLVEIVTLTGTRWAQASAFRPESSFTAAQDDRFHDVGGTLPMEYGLLSKFAAPAIVPFPH